MHHHNNVKDHIVFTAYQSYVLVAASPHEISVCRYVCRVFQSRCTEFA